MPRRVLKALRLVLVDQVDEVLREALVLSDPDAVFGARAPEGVIVYLDGEPVTSGQGDGQAQKPPATTPPLPTPPLPASPPPGEQPGA